jgi:hypothetical protein
MMLLRILEVCAIRMLSNSINILMIILLWGLFGCEKDHPNKPIISQPSKYEVIKGKYKVYDTLGVYLFDMSIEYSSALDSNGIRRDYLHFKNFDGQFNFKYWQTALDIPNWAKNYFYIGVHDPIVDTANNRWKIMSYNDGVHNALVDDTIKLWYNKNNIKYYINDVTPYFGGMCYQNAVKQ